MLEGCFVVKSGKITPPPSSNPMKQLTIPSVLRFLLRLLLTILALALALAGTFFLAYRLSDRTNGRLRVGEETRRYLLYVPPTYDPATPTPLVISLHGFAQWPAHQSNLTHWNTLADEYGFIVVHPSGTGFPKRWLAADPRADNPDVAFLAVLIDQLEREYNIDPQRIYVNGLSNGGGMSFALACRLADRIAAFGGVGGAYLYPWEACQPARPVPAILFHGDADPIVPYQGGPSKSFDIPFPVIPQWVETLALRNNCDLPPQEMPISAHVTERRYTNCAADVVFYTIAGGGHTWPGGEPLPEWLTGPTNTEIDATRLMWAFFQAHPLESP
jgi:polyhydroxybutyrate depolymerase